jgi:hypothetical protein
VAPSARAQDAVRIMGREHECGLVVLCAQQRDLNAFRRSGEKGVSLSLVQYELYTQSGSDIVSKIATVSS